MTRFLDHEELPITQILILVSLILVGRPALWASVETDAARKTFPVDRWQHAIEPVICSTGTTTYLERGGLIRSMRLDGNEGESHFVLRSKKSGSALWKDERVGQWECLGFNPITHTYILASHHRL